VLLVAEPAADPRLSKLSHDALSSWFAAVTRCGMFNTDILEREELDGASDFDVDEWVNAALAARLPLGYMRMLAGGSLWEHDATERAAGHVSPASLFEAPRDFRNPAR
jgi:hypothetical protein